MQVLYTVFSGQKPKVPAIFTLLMFAPSVQVLYTVFSGQKPKVPEDMPQELKQLMMQCWSTDPACRPTFKCVATCLRSMLMSVRGTDLTATIPVGKSSPERESLELSRAPSSGAGETGAE